MSAMLTLEEAWERLLALAPEMPETAMHQWSFTRYASRDIKALRSQPAHDLSAMDGFAICGKGPWIQVGESRAGHPFLATLSHGECVRISTGSWVPEGADRILIQENAEVSGSSIALAQGETMPHAGQHIRRKGFDFVEGDVLIKAGTKLGPAQIALGRAGGQDDFMSRVAPPVDILECGDELEECASVCVDGVAKIYNASFKIPATNGRMIAEMLSPYVPCTPLLGPVDDNLPALAEALSQSQGRVLITSGGASVGDHDLIQQALRDWGAQIDFWKVAIKPGKPLMVATRGKQLILGLPGNPVSSFVTSFLFALPLIRKAMGAADPLPKHQSVTLAEKLPGTGSRREFLRGISDGATVRLAGSQDSSALRSLAMANCLIDRPANALPVSAGDTVLVYNLQNG